MLQSSAHRHSFDGTPVSDPTRGLRDGRVFHSTVLFFPADALAAFMRVVASPIGCRALRKPTAIEKSALWGPGWRLWASLWVLGGMAGEPAAFSDFKPETARDYLRAVVQTVQEEVGTDADACFVLARVRDQLGEKVEAERLARLALESDPRRAEIQMFLTGLLIHQDRMEEAVGCLREAVRLKPEIPGGYRQLGMVLDRLGDREGARKAFEMSLQQAPQDGTAWLVLGRLLLDQGQTGDARVHLEKACQLDPKLSGAFYALSQAQSRLGAAEAARESMNTFRQLKQSEKAELDARNTGYDDEKFMRVLAAGFHTEVAELFLRKEQVAAAEAHLRQAVRIAPQEPRGHEVLAALLVQTGRLPEARGMYEALVRLKPTQAGYRLNLGTTLLQLQDYPAAVEQLKRALELDPKQPGALGNLARFYLSSRQDLPEALGLCRRLVDSQPTAASYDLLGWACYANGLTNEARLAAAQAVERDPANTVYRERYQRLQSPP